jgi:hypothetical protein
MAVMPFDHSRIGVSKVLGDDEQGSPGHDR